MHSEVMEKTCHQRRKLLQNNNQIFPPAAVGVVGENVY
jgi:hypothetical protein